MSMFACALKFMCVCVVHFPSIFQEEICFGDKVDSVEP